MRLKRKERGEGLLVWVWYYRLSRIKVGNRLLFPSKGMLVSPFLKLQAAVGLFAVVQFGGAGSAGGGGEGVGGFPSQAPLGVGPPQASVFCVKGRS